MRLVAGPRFCQTSGMVQDDGDPIRVGGKSASVFLSELSDAVQALRSLQAGASAPPSAASPSGAFWLDTTSGQEIVRQRDVAGTAWNAMWRLGAGPLAIAPNETAKTAAHDADKADGFTGYTYDTSGGVVAVTLDSAKVNEWQPFVFLLETGGNNLTIAPKAGQTWAGGGSSAVVVGSAAGDLAWAFYGNGVWWTW